MKNNIVQTYLENGWTFRYDSHSRFIGAYHPDGGERSICELYAFSYNRDEFGLAIAEILNSLVNKLCKNLKSEECPECSKKQLKKVGGYTPLCDSCLHNRRIIKDIKNKYRPPEPKIDTKSIIEKLRKEFAQDYKPYDSLKYRIVKIPKNNY
jgi:hypothetical protein